MNLAIGVLFIWLGCSLLFLASHGLGASTPWSAFQTVVGKMRGDTGVA